ncbi:uncharacterized protein [Nicotiana tomentosiformis]|uniref:uncharacterized protein n=1 Tax=Nicotiana tomentosiformis TaxID=4098 RepID=UPI00388C9A8A
MGQLLLVGLLAHEERQVASVITSFDYCLFGSSAANTVAERRTKIRNDILKEAQVEKSSKELTLLNAKKRRKHMDDASSVKGKEVDARTSSDTRDEKIIADEIKLFVKHPPISSSHISSYTNTNIVSDLKENFTPEQYNIFGTTYFGSFLDIKRCEVQHQLFKCFMVLQLEGSHDDSFSIYVNGTTLSFSIRELALVTGLNCVSDLEDFQFNTKVPNGIVDIYFGGAKNVKKKDLLKCFDDKNWGHDNDRDAIKIVVLYFIHTFIFFSEKNSTIISRLHFDLVESERYSDYPWGKDAFQYLIKSISKKVDSQKKYYRIAGMPLAMQVWFYECCSKVDPKIALRVANRIPRILNWKSTVNQPTYALMNDMFNDQGNMIVYNDIQQSDIELAVIQIPPEGVDVENSPTYSDNNEDDSDDFSPTPPLQPKKKHDASVGPSSSPPHKKRKQQIIDPSNAESPIPHVSSIPQSKIPPAGISEIKEIVLHVKKLADSKSDDLSSLRKDLNSFKDYVSIVKTYSTLQFMY